MVSDPALYAGSQVRLVAVDMDGTLLDDQKNFPPGLDELIDQLEKHGIVFVPASGRQIWTLINMFPGRAGMTFIGENGAIVMRDGQEISSSPLDLETVRKCVELVRHHARQGGFFAARTDVQDGKAQDVEAAQWDGGLVVCGKKSAYIERSDEPFLHAIVPYYARTQVVEDLLEVLDEIERGELDDAIIKLALRSAGDVRPLADWLNELWECSSRVINSRSLVITGRICRCAESIKAKLSASCRSIWGSHLRKPQFLEMRETTLG